MVDFSSYPNCVGGDVHIYFSAGKHMQLHYEILARHSPWFTKQFQTHEPASIDYATKKAGISIRYRFDYKKSSGTGYGSCDVGELCFTLLNNQGKPAAGQYIASTNYMAGKVEQIPEFYEKILGAMYSRPLILDKTDHRIGNLLPEIMGLTEIAEYLGCVHVVYDRLDKQLLEFGQVLWQAIATEPKAWLNLGARLHSFAITREAMIHVVGRWYQYSEEDKEDVPEILLPVLEERAEWLEKTKEEVQDKLILYSPEALHRDLNRVDCKSLQVVCYGKDVLDWMALNFWNKYFTFGIFKHNRGIRGPDAGFTLLSSIWHQNDGVLGELDLKRFLNIHPMTARGATQLRKRVQCLKSDIAKIVQPVMNSELNLDLSKALFVGDFYTSVEINKSHLACVTEPLVAEEMNWEKSIETLKRSDEQGVKRKSRIGSESSVMIGSCSTKLSSTGPKEKNVETVDDVSMGADDEDQSEEEEEEEEEGEDGDENMEDSQENEKVEGVEKAENGMDWAK